MLGEPLIWKKRLYFFVIATVYLIYMIAMSTHNLWGLFAERWHMSLTMVLGSLIAGATPEGGGAVAYPVMTLGFKVPPAEARDFSLLIQAVGMSAASLWIYSRGIKIERRYLAICLPMSLVGFFVGALFLRSLIAPTYAKISFVCFWLAFGMILFWLNHIRHRETVDRLPSLNDNERNRLAFVGFIGGVLSSIYGNGVDICTFAYVTMRFGLSEKVATPTSVILMASNALFGVLCTQLSSSVLSSTVLDFWLVCIPVVLIGAPFGAYLTSKVKRLWIAGLLYTLILTQFVAAILIIQPSGSLLGSACLAFFIGLFIFSLGTRGSELKNASRTKQV